jgi:hypothetical protein
VIVHRTTVDLPFRVKSDVDRIRQDTGETQNAVILKALMLYINHHDNAQRGGHTDMTLPDGVTVRWMTL